MSGLAKGLNVVFLASCLWTPVAAVDYVAPKLICVLGSADAVVRVGNSETVIDDFAVEIEEVIRGESLHASDSIRIAGVGKWYAETPLASLADYSDAILFLNREIESDVWRIVGPLGAGRMLVRDGYAYLAGFQTNIPRKQYWRGKPGLQRLALATLLQADRDLGTCLKWHQDKDTVQPRLVCSMPELQALKDRSELHRLLVDEVIAGLESGLICAR